MFKGSIVALITPMRPDGSLDEAAYARFIDWQIEQGSEGIVAVGTTGESPTLTHEEHRRAVEIAVRAADKRVPVIAGAGSNSTAEAKSAGFDVKVLRQIIRLRKQEPAEIEEQETLLDLYKRALGM